MAHVRQFIADFGSENTSRLFRGYIGLESEI